MPDRKDGEPDRDRQADAAGELADRAAESVGRRYDATKEIHLGEPETDETKTGGKNEAKDEAKDEDAE